MRVKQRPRVKIDVPINVQAVVDSLLGTPLVDTAAVGVLRAFAWSFDKGDIHHWTPVLDHFDAFLEEAAARSDVQLLSSEPGLQPEQPFPADTIEAVLGVTCALLENCSNARAVYNSSEHLTSLLAAPAPAVVVAVLQTLQVLARRTHHVPTRWAPPAGLAHRLLCMSRGWGGKEEGLELLVCVSPDESAVCKVLHKVTTLHYEFIPDSSGTTAGAAGTATTADCADGATQAPRLQAQHVGASGRTVLHVPGVDGFAEDEHAILDELVRRFNVPQSAKFELLCRVRLARGFGSLEGRRQLVRMRLVAFNTLLQCSPPSDELHALLFGEPELPSELVGVVQAEETAPEELRTLALRALAAQLHDRLRSSSSVVGAITSGGQSGLLGMLLHKSIASVLQQAGVSFLPEYVSTATPTANMAASPAGAASPSVVTAVSPPLSSSPRYSVAFVEALLAVVSALVQSSAGCQALNDAGVVPALLPLLRDTQTEHLGLVCSALKILEAYMDLSQPASSTFRELGGVGEMVRRVAVEVGLQHSSSGSEPAAAAAGSNADMAATEEQAQSMAAPQQGQTDSAAEATATKPLSHSRKMLLKLLLRTITLSSYAPSGALAAARPHDEDSALLYACLKEVYKRPEEFGGSLFSLAVSVMTDLIHHEPQSFTHVHAAGLPDAFLAAIKAGVLPSGDAIVSIPGALVALCLNSAGLRRVRETAALVVVLDVFVSRKTARVLTSDTPAILGGGLEELLRFVPSLRSDGVDVVLAVFRALCILGGDEEEAVTAARPLPSLTPEAEQPSAPAAAAAEPANAAAGAAAAGGAADLPSASPALQPMDTDLTIESGAGAVLDAQAGTPGSGTAGMDVDAPTATSTAGDASAAAARDVAIAAATPAASSAAQQREAERERERREQAAEDVRLSAVSRRAVAQALQAVVTARDGDADVEAFLPLALTAASRMLEPLLANAETSRMFVERGGVELLLKLYRLPRLTAVFNFSSASHSLLSVFRGLSGAHGPAIAAKAKDALAGQVAALLPQAEALGSVCVPTLASEQRDAYAKQVLAVQGLVALSSAVARNVSAMLPLVSMGDPPLLASMGRLERIVMAQSAASDPWKQARDAAKRDTSAANLAGDDDEVPPPTTAVDTGEDGANAVEVPAVASTDLLAGANAASGNDGLVDEDMDAAAADAAADGSTAPETTVLATLAAPGMMGNAVSKLRRAPEDISYDALSYLLTSLRTFYMGTAKAIHTPVRRRDEPAGTLSVPMKAAALNLAALLVGNLRLQPWQHGPGSEPLQQPCSSHALASATDAVRRRSGHLLRITEELSFVLFDSRRSCCHLLVLNFFAALGGLTALGERFWDATQLLADLTAAKEASADTSGTASHPATLPTSTGAALEQGSGAAADAQVGGAGGTAASCSGFKDPRQVVEAVLVKMLSLYEQLSNASVLLAMPQASTMLVAALPNYAGGPLVPPAKDALGFVAALHARVLAAVLPLWSHPVACHAPPGVLTSLIRVLQTCAQGPGHASLILRYSQAGRAPAPRPVPQPDPALVQQIVEMGFAQARAEEALRRVGANSVELAMEWLILHPEEHQQPAQATDGETPMAAATAASAGSTPASQAALATAAGEAEEEELTRALLASLSMVGMSPSTVAHQQAAQQQLLLESAPQLPLAAPGANRATDAAELSEEQHLLPSATAAAPPTTLAETSTSATAAMTCPTAPPTQAGTAQAGGATAEAAGIPEPAQLVDGAVRLAAAVPVTAFSIAELLATIAQRGSEDRRSVVACLLDGCLPRASGAAAAESGALLQAAGTELICARLLLLLLQKDGPSRVVAADQGLPGRALAALEGWQQHYASLVQAWQAEGQQQQDAAMLEVPVLVEALLLLLDAMATTTPASGSGSGSSRGRQGAQGQAARHVGQVAPSAPGNSAAAPAAPSASAEAALDTAAAAPAATAHPQHPDADVAMQEATAGSTSAAAGGSGSDTCPATDWATGVERVKLPAELGALPGLAAALNGWRPCGALNEQQQAAATSLCVALLQQLHDHASTWEHSDRSMFDADCGLPSPAALTHALLQLLGHLTKRYANAQQVLAAGGHRLLLSLPAACLVPGVSRFEAGIGAVLRNLLEDPATLESWMEAEIRSSMTIKGPMRDPYTGRAFPSNSYANPTSRYTSASSFLSIMSSLVNREPAVFLQAVARTCTLDSTGRPGGETVVRLRTGKEQQQQQQQQQQQMHVEAAVSASRDAKQLLVTGGAANSQPQGTQQHTSAPGSNPLQVGDASTSRAASCKPSSQKASRKQVPASFAEVVDALLDVVMAYPGAQQIAGRQACPGTIRQKTTAAMELDSPAPSAGGSNATTAPVAHAAPVRGVQDAVPLPADVLLRKLGAPPRDVGMQALVLRLLGDYCLLFGSSVGLLLKRDGGHHAHDAQLPVQPPTAATPGSERRGRKPPCSGAAGQQTGLADSARAGVVLSQLLHVQLLDPPAAAAGGGAAVAANASSLLQAVCIRSSEGRRRIMAELVAMLLGQAARHPCHSSDADAAGSCSSAASGGDAPPFLARRPCTPGQAPLPAPSPTEVAACIKLLGALVQSGSNVSSVMGRSDPRQTGGSMPVEVLRALRDAGAVKALARTLELVDMHHPQSKEAINAILKPLEVLTRILPKHAVAPSERSGQELGSAQQGAQPNPTTTSSGAAPGREQGLQQGGQGELGAAAEVRPGPTAAAATHTRTGAAAPSPHSVQGHAAPDSQQPDAVGRTVMDEDIRDSRQGEAAAGPAALAAAGRYVPGGARLGRQREGDVLDQLLEHYVDIQVRLGSDDSGDDDDDDDDEDGSEPSSSVVDGDDDGHPADASDEEMADGHDGSGSEEGHGVPGDSDDAGLDAPSLTDESDGSDAQGDSDAEHAVLLGSSGAAAFIDADAAAAALGGGSGAGGAGARLGELSGSDDDHDNLHGGSHGGDFVEALLQEDADMADMQADMDGHAQGMVPLDDDEEEDEEEEEEDEEEEYLDEGSDEEEGWGADAMADALDMADAGLQPGSWGGLHPLLDGMPGGGAGGASFGRMPGRRVMLRQGTASAAAGVWDDADADVDTVEGTLGVPMSSIQALLSQLGLGGASNVSVVGPGGRPLRMSALMLQDGSAPDAARSASAAGNAASTTRALSGAMQSLLLQLLPAQHRLLAQPPRLPASEVAAMLTTADAAAAGADAASSVHALSRLLARGGGPDAAALRDTRGRSGRSGLLLGSGGMLVPGGPGGGPLHGALGSMGGPAQGAGGLLGAPSSSVWDEAVSQVLAALAPQGLSRPRQAAAVPPGAPRGGAEDGGLDPRSLESHIVALLQREAPPSAAADTRLPGGSAAATAVQQQQQPQQLHGAQDASQQLPAPPQEPAESMDAATAVAALGVPAAPGPAPHTDVPIATTRHAAPAADIGETSSLGVAAMAVTDVSTEAAAGTASMQAAAAQGTDSVNLPTLSTSLSPTAVSMVQQELDAQPQAGSALHPVQAVQAMMAHDAAEGTQAAAAAPMDSDTAVASSLDEHVNAAALATVPAAMDADASGAEGAAAAPSPGEDSGLAAALAEAAAAAEIDLAFLEALPEELRVEVLAARGVTLRAAGAEVVQRDAGDTAAPASTAAAHDSTMSGGLPTTGAAGADTGAAAATTPVASASEAEAIDPEFLAALPEDIRQELLAQQRASARAAAARAAAAARGQQPEIGLADLLAAMPDDARADALTQLSDDDLLQLPTQMREQAQALRERMRQLQAQQRQQQAAVAAQQDLLRRQIGDAGLGNLGSGRMMLPLGSANGMPLSRGLFGGGAAAAALLERRAELLEAQRAASSEADGPATLDEPELRMLVLLLRASQPLSKAHLQKLFLNLVGNTATREQLLGMLLALVRTLPGTAVSDGSDAMEDSDVCELRPPPNVPAPHTGLAAALGMLTPAPLESGGNYDAAAAALSHGGKPAIVTRRVLDMLTYLARSSVPVARQLLHLRVPLMGAPLSPPDDKGKAPLQRVGTAAPKAGDQQQPRALNVLLAMLSSPLCQRSVSLLEQLLLLLEVVLTVVQRREAGQHALDELAQELRRQQQQRPPEQHAPSSERQGNDGAAEEAAAVMPATALAAAHSASAAADTGAAVTIDTVQPAGVAETQQQQSAAAAAPSGRGSSSLQQQNQQSSSPSLQQQSQGELACILDSVDTELLQALPRLLTRESLSEPAYASIAKVLKLVVEAAPHTLTLMLTVLEDGAATAAHSLLASLDSAAQYGIDADAQLAPAIGTKSGVVLRLLYALQGFQQEVKAWAKQQLEQQQQQEGKLQEEKQQEEKQQDEQPATSAVAGHAASSSAAAVLPVAAAGASITAGASSSTAVVAVVPGLDPAAAVREVNSAISSVAERTLPLWQALSSAILRVEDNLRAVLPAHTHAAGESAGSAAARLLPPGAQQVLPLVEAFFVLCALQGTCTIPGTPTTTAAKDLLRAPSTESQHLPLLGAAPLAGRSSTPPPCVSGLLRAAGTVGRDSGTAASDASTLPFLRFAERHRRLLNAYIRRNTGLLESSLNPLLHTPRLIDFDNKRAYFRSKVRASSDDHGTYPGTLRLAVKRSSVFEDSFNKLRSKTAAEMRGKLSVAFAGEEGIDAGGVSREWYSVMAREIFNPNLALFVAVPEGGTTFQPNPNSIVQSDTGVSHLEFFKFVGRLVGKALYDGQMLDAYFTRSFYKHMLGQPLTYEDIEAVDPEYHKNLKWMLENDITDVLDLTFTAESDFFGKTEVVELVPEGREVRVTEANKHEYVNLIARHRMTTSIRTQIQAFLDGFWQLVPRELINIFNDHELELLISGLPDIDVADLRANTEYSGYSPSSPVIQWLWQVVAEMDKQDLALLLQFVTGTSKVPLDGFRSLQGISGPQRFQIHKSYGATDRLPSAHTCFNQLDLPEYTSKEQLAERLTMAINEGHEGFGFG